MEINSITDFLEILKSFYRDKSIRYWFRGHADESWELIPTIWRDYTEKEERYMAHEFLWQAKVRTDKYPKDRDWPGWLQIMQHYGLPTRLLDWSYSPLIALYFAMDKYHKNPKDISNAAIWLLEPQELNIGFDTKGFIPSPYNWEAQKMIEPVFINPNDVIKDYQDRIFAVSAVQDDKRMMAQQSTFTIHSSKKSLLNYSENKSCLKKINIPKESIGLISAELEILGIEQSSVFPDLENLSKQLARNYK